MQDSTPKKVIKLKHLFKTIYAGDKENSTKKLIINKHQSSKLVHIDRQKVSDLGEIE